MKLQFENALRSVWRGAHAIIPLGFVFFCSACAHEPKLKHDYNERLTIQCKVLGRVEETVIPFTNMFLITSQVRIEILEPAGLRSTNGELILQRGDARDQPRIDPDSLWREIGSTQTVEAVRNKDTGELFLFPPLNTPRSRWNF